MNTPLALDDLEKAAEAATPGKRELDWEGFEDGWGEADFSVPVGMFVPDVLDSEGHPTALVSTEGGFANTQGPWSRKQVIADAKFMAMLDPATVLELVRGYKQAQAARTHIRAFIDFEDDPELFIALDLVTDEQRQALSMSEAEQAFHENPYLPEKEVGQ